METITLTFGDCGENHVGMQQIGKKEEYGFKKSDLKKFKTHFETCGKECELIRIICPKTDSIEPVSKQTSMKAYLLVVRNAVDTADSIFEEQKNLSWDKKAFMYGRVVNKKARYNLCFDTNDQVADYENKRGTILSWKSVPHTAELKALLESIVQKSLIGEGNRYYDVNECGIGYHGDTERRIVIGARFGHSMNLKYLWFYKNKPIGDPIEIQLNHGDLYIMSDKAVGHDWKKRNLPTLRHSAGSPKFTTV